MNTDYDELAERAEHGEIKVKPGTALRGSSASAATQRLFMEISGATSANELTSIVLGQPALGAKDAENEHRTGTSS